jgi:CcmD family protein
MLLTLVMFVSAALAQTPAPGEFVSQDTLPKQEVAPAPLVFAAYAVVWGVLVVYLFFLWRRIGRVERDLADVHRKLARK